jgi:hypothetical protein
LLPARATSSFTTFAGQAGWRGIKPSLDALLDVAATGSSIKPTSPPAAWPLHKSNGISRRGKEGDITQPSLSPVVGDGLLGRRDLDLASTNKVMQPNFEFVLPLR